MTEEKVLELFGQGFDCGQVVLSVCAEETGLDDATAKRLASCFGAGMFCAEVCGAVSGGLMAIGAKYGHTEPNTPEVKHAMLAKNMAFQQKMREEFGSTVCRKILGYDLTIPEQKAAIDREQLLVKLCPKVVCAAIRNVKEIL